jgi:hypothetical protein
MKPITDDRQGIESIARMAMEWGARHLKDYGSDRSRHDFTQRQLMACLIVRAALKTTYRGFLDLLAENGALRDELGLSDKLPHYTTLQKFNARNRILAIAEAVMQSAPAFPRTRQVELAPNTATRGRGLVRETTGNFSRSQVKRFTAAPQP